MTARITRRRSSWSTCSSRVPVNRSTASRPRASKYERDARAERRCDQDDADPGGEPEYQARDRGHHVFGQRGERGGGVEQHEHTRRGRAERANVVVQPGQVGKPTMTATAAPAPVVRRGRPAGWPWTAPARQIWGRIGGYRVRTRGDHLARTRHIGDRRGVDWEIRGPTGILVNRATP